MKFSATFLIAFLLSAIISPLPAAITVGILSDFEDGSVQGWGGGASPINITSGGPAGDGDHFLQIGNGGNLATHNTSPDFSGEVEAGLMVFLADMMRPSDDLSPLEIRLNLLGPGTGNRWVSTLSATIPNDGIWRRYAFPFDEASLTRVLGDGSYEALRGNINRVMFRYDPGDPSASGSAIDGTLGIDNIEVAPIPEPGTAALLGLGFFFAMFRRSRR